jgi:hypothetical protein
MMILPGLHKIASAFSKFLVFRKEKKLEKSITY